MNSIELMIDGRPISARVVDAGDARVEVDPGDWAILKVNENIDLPALNRGLPGCPRDAPGSWRVLW